MNSYNECKAIIELDLDPIKVKLMHEESGEGWSREQADAVESEYRRYLFLMKVFPNEPVAPRADVDIFWHYHILDTMKYAEDCEEIFGYFLHHFPYVGLRGETDEEAHQDAANRMSELYEQTFHEPYVEVASPGTSGTAYSTRVPENAISATAGKTAYSTRVPQDAISATAGKTAYSTRVPQDAISATAGKTAYSTRVPQDAISATAGKTAYSTRVPQDAISGTAGKTAYSTRVPLNAISATAGKTAYSTRVPQNAAGAYLFKMERPTLAAA
jgi:hypothetical protein